MTNRTIPAGMLAILLSLLLWGCSEDGTQINPPPDQTPLPTSGPYSYNWSPLTPKTGDLVLVDRETRSTFNMRGEAFAGPLAAKKRLLRRIHGVNMFWFAWSVFYPGSDVWGAGARVRDATLPTNKAGILGCSGGADCIPSLPNSGPPAGDLAWAKPGSSGASYLEDSELVMGVFHKGVARAYSHNLLWWHEIANDKIGDDSFSMTFCPLTGSGVAFAGTGGRTFGVSGNLFNSNLVMYDHATSSLWPQLWMGAVSGPEGDKKTWLKTFPAVEMTWKAWRELHPDTLVLSSGSGYTRDYTSYPYGGYRTDHKDTFATTSPAPDTAYKNKSMIFGLVDRENGKARGYVHEDLFSKRGSSGAINDSFAGNAVVVVFHKTMKLVQAFEAKTPDGTLTFDAVPYKP